MSASPLYLYTAALTAKNDGTLSLADNFKLVLLTEAYVPNYSTHALFSDISANEVAAGGGYTSGGEVVTLTQSVTGNVLTVTAGDLSWTQSDITAKYAAIVRDANNDGTLDPGDLLLGYADLKTEGGSVSSSNGTFGVNFSPSGLITESIQAPA